MRLGYASQPLSRLSAVQVTLFAKLRRVTDLPLFYSDHRPNATRFARFPAIRRHPAIRPFSPQIFRELRFERVWTGFVRDFGTWSQPRIWAHIPGASASLAAGKESDLPNFRPRDTNEHWAAVERRNRHNRIIKLAGCGTASCGSMNRPLQMPVYLRCSLAAIKTIWL